MASLKKIQDFCKGRDEAVKSMNVDTFRDWAKKVGCPDFNAPDEVIEITMRKMAVHITSLDVDTRVEAFRWLLENGHDFDLE